MTEQEILTNNRLIAEFMGGKYYELDVDKDDIWIPFHGICDYTKLTGKHLEYHCSWGWLMPVWEKIVKDRNNIPTEINIAYLTNIIYGLYHCDIKITYKAIIEFIKWYNTQTH